jgi:hypothetical protein
MLTVVPTGASLIDSYHGRSTEAEPYSPEFRAALAQCGAWSAEARTVLALAAQLRITLDENRLKLCDVHDLQALRFALVERVCGSRGA